eukprot:TRINITY_DN34640_c0_g1_i1.p1 TRINITY_DN34640_c0_g1~~TRINITY_DN34640_c0_g1_i1.p1  ORF type:complete len:289 (+),score=83.38 TRINITY_DN34640_c0_g1_i1:108-974(+)
MVQVLGTSDVQDMHPCHGHAGTFLTDRRGTILKQSVPSEREAYESLRSDALSEFVPPFLGEANVEGRGSYIVLKDVTVGFGKPCVMDCKMGQRTFLECDCSNQVPRADLYKKLVAISKELPTEQEDKVQAVSKLRYMTAREALSSTAGLGFRIDGVTGGVVASDTLKTVKTEGEVSQVFNAYLAHVAPSPESRRAVVKAVVARLEAYSAALQQSDFFKSHEMIGSSLLFVADASAPAAGVWLIDLAKCLPLPSGVAVTHTQPWQQGNHEDGYLFGLENMIRTWKSLAE